MSAQTAIWSDARSPRSAIDRETWAIRFARPVAYWVRGAVANRLDFARQRPASTHDTGIISSDSAGHEDGQVDDPVLLRANELLAIDDERRLGAAIDHAELRHARRPRTLL